MSDYMRDEFANGVLGALGVEGRLGAFRATIAWMKAESGDAVCDGTSGAKFNPLNTTLSWAGATNFNNVGVKNYKTYANGKDATVATLQENQYGGVLATMRQQNVSAQAVMEAIAGSPWGTPLDVLLGALDTYNGNRAKYNTLPLGP